MDFIDETLNKSALNPSYHHSVRAAVSLAKRVMNKYYERTDLSDTYRIAMSESFSFLLLLLHCILIMLDHSIIVLYPRHKLGYFEDAKWEPDWIATAKHLLYEEFNTNYRSKFSYGAGLEQNDVAAGLSSTGQGGLTSKVSTHYCNVCDGSPMSYLPEYVHESTRLIQDSADGSE